MVPRRAVALAVAATITTAAACTAPGADSTPSDSVVAAAPADIFVPGFDPTDPATAAFAVWLESVREGGRAAPGRPEVLTGCGGDTGVVHPVEMLAVWEITGRTRRGDTTVMRARAVTVAEENLMGTTPERYMAVQRSRQSEWEWDVVRDGDRWYVCNGPRFGFAGTDSLTSWRPAGASRATARARAESLWATRRRANDR